MPGSSSRPGLALPALLLAATACGGSPRGPTPEPPSARVAVVADREATAVAAALLFPGSGWELPGTEGLTLLTAETLLEGAAPALETLGARAEVQCERAAFTFTLVAPPDEWPAALDIMLDALFQADPTPGALERATDRLRSSLALDHASPAWQARLAARQALYADTLGTSPWEVPGCGIPELLGSFDLEHIRAGAYRFAPRLARAAVVGPVDSTATVTRLGARIPPAYTPPLPSPRRTEPGRRYSERNTVTAWVGVAFPYGPGVDEEALRFLGTLLVGELGPHVSRPDVFAASYELERHGAGGALIVHMVTRPEAAAIYADRIETRVRAVAEVELPTRVWEPVLRRFRGRRLLARELPEARAAALARSLADGSGGGDGWPDPGTLSPERVRSAAASLAPPARSVVGPRSARPAVVP